MKGFLDANSRVPKVTAPQFHLVSNRSITFDGRFEIIEYTDEYIVLRCNSLKIKIFGSDITVGEFNGEEALITGIFVRMEFS